MITEKEFKNLKVGDKVLLTGERPFYWDSDGKMDKFLGKVVEIHRVTKNFKTFNIVNETCEFSFKDIVKVIGREDKQEIHIYRKGNEVHAIEKKNGEVVDKAVADEFDFAIGATTAFKRLKSQKSLLSVVESAKKTFEPYPWQVEVHEAFNNHKPQLVVHTESRLNPKVINYTISLKSAGKSFDQLVKEIEDVCTKEIGENKERNDMIEYFNKLTELQNEIASIPRLKNQVAEESSIKNGTKVRIKNMDIFKEVSESILATETNFVCLDEYIGKRGEVYEFDNLRKDFQILFDDNYMCAIDEENENLYFTKDNVEII